MSRKIKIYFLAFLFCLAVFPLSSCSRTPDVEDIIVEFWTSSDGGQTYQKDVFEHPGFGSIFLILKIQIHTDRNRASFHTATLSIGESENIDARIIG